MSCVLDLRSAICCSNFTRAWVSDEILQAYKQQEALQNSVKTLDDYRKMQEQVKTKDERTNDLLKTRLELLEKAKATGQLTPVGVRFPTTLRTVEGSCISVF